MKFSEIANRLTGISTPLGGVSWQSSNLEVSAARRVIAFLEDRRVLYAPDELEVPSHCVHSVLEIRHFLSCELGKLDTKNHEAKRQLPEARVVPLDPCYENGTELRLPGHCVRGSAWDYVNGP